MNLLIYGLPRTRTSLILSSIEGNNFYEPFHHDKNVRNGGQAHLGGVLKKQTPIWEWGGDKIEFVHNLKFDANIKTLVPHQSFEDSLRLHDWADIVIHPIRNYLAVACSYCLASQKNIWNTPDQKNEPVKAEPQYIEQIVEWIQQFENIREQLHGTTVIEMQYEDITPKNLQELFTKNQLTYKPTIMKPTRKESPEEMITNLKYVKSVLKDNEIIF